MMENFILNLILRHNNKVLQFKKIFSKKIQKRIEFHYFDAPTEDNFTLL